MLLSSVAVFALVRLAFGAEAPNDALQKGLFEEEANRNLDAAIQAYQSVVDQYDAQRKAAATAVFRLGECYRKQGKTNDAVAQYQRVLVEFSDHAALAKLSRENLGVMAPGLAAESLQPAARLPGLKAGIPSTLAGLMRQYQFIKQELKLLEKQLALTERRIELGKADELEAIPVQREILALQRQLVDTEEALRAAEQAETAAATRASPAVDASRLPGKAAGEPQRR